MVDALGGRNAFVRPAALSSLLTLVLLAAIGCEKDSASFDASLDAQITDSGAPVDATLEDSGDPLDSGPDDAQDSGMEDQILDGNVSVRDTCDQTCAQIGSTCNPNHIWFLGLEAGGIATYGMNQEVMQALACDETPEESVTEMTVQYDLMRIRCACS